MTPTNPPADKHDDSAAANSPGRWAEGADHIEDMIDAGLIDKNVYANPDDIEALFDDAATHLDSADNLKDKDPRGAYSIMYTGVRKTLVAALLNKDFAPKAAKEDTDTSTKRSKRNWAPRQDESSTRSIACAGNETAPTTTPEHP